MTRRTFTLPDLGEGLTEARLIRWLVASGDEIAVDAPVAEVETAKAVVEVPSPYGGTIGELHAEEGATVTVGGPLVSVDSPDSAPGGSPDASSTATGSALPAPSSTAPHSTASNGEDSSSGGSESGNVLIGYGTRPEPRGTRRRHRSTATSSVPAVPSSVVPSAQAPVPSQAPQPVSTPESPAEPGIPAPRNSAQRNPPTVAERPRAQSPLVRRLAAERGLDLATVTGTGPNGLVTRTDVERAIPADDVPAITEPTTQSPTAPTASATNSPIDTDGRTGLAIAERIAIRGMRQAIATTLTRSRREIPEATAWVDVDATPLVQLRAALRTETDRGPGLLALIARFVVAGLSRFPALNSRVDTDAQEIQHLDGVNLGIATQAPHGLVVPAVRNAHRLNARELDTRIRDITEAARTGTASAADLTSGSFTLNNYGSFGVDGSAAIINHPEVAILGVGRVMPRPWVLDGNIIARDITKLSLVFDHRVCDGGTASGFLRFVADAIENPRTALADI